MKTYEEQSEIIEELRAKLKRMQEALFGLERFATEFISGAAPQANYDGGNRFADQEQAIINARKALEE